MTTITVADECTDREALLERAARLAPELAGATAVAVVAHARMDTVVTVLAALDAGVPLVPISPDAGPRERDHVLADSGASLMHEDGRMTALAARGGASRPDGDIILYTSGTTGPPKGVPVTMAAIRACLDGLADAWEWTPDDLLVHGLPLHHVHGLVLGVLGPLHVGSSLHHTGRPTPSAYAAAGGSLYFGVPTIWARVTADASAARTLASARLLVSGSAGLPAPVFDALRAHGGRAPVERYGMTETLITIAARADEPRQRGSVGRPLPGIAVRLVAEDGAPAPTGAIGEVQVRGGTVFNGYLHRPDATAASLTPDAWFRTGDVATVDESGTYRIIGRASTDLIKTGGYRVGAGEVEDALLAHPAVGQAVVVGEPDDDLGQRIIAYVVADGVDEDDLVAHVSRTLSHHKRPRSVRFVEELPRNAMGKVDKSRLRP